MRSIRSIVSLLLIIVVLIFALQNIAAVEIQFLFWSFSIPRALLIAALMSIGSIIEKYLLANFKLSMVLEHNYDASSMPRHHD